MMKLEEIAFNNLQFLNDRDDFLANRYRIDKNRIVKEDDDTIYTLDDLEYPLFFTFHQLMNHVHSSYERRFYGKTKKELLDMFEIALNTLNEYYIETDNSNKRFERVIDDIDDKITFIIQYYKYGFCHRFPTVVKDYFTKGCKLLLDSSRLIVKEYIDDDENDDKTTDGKDDEKDDETGEVNPNLIYKDDETKDDETKDDETTDDETKGDETKDDETNDDESSTDELIDIDDTKDKEV